MTKPKTWKIEATQNDEAWFDDLVLDILDHEPAPLPPHDAKWGHVETHWHQIKTGVAYVYGNPATGSADDRRFAEALVVAQLEPHGFKRATWEYRYDHSDMTKVATWADIEAKARRLIQSGAVQLLRNGYNTIIGQVQGDHGNYKTEISRDDPNSQAISGSTCECLLPGGQIVLSDGSVKRIEECEPGDRVLTASGGIGVVKHLWVNDYDGEAVALRPTGGTEKVWVTANHPVFDSADNLRDASDFAKGDLVYYPRPTTEATLVLCPMDYLDDARFIEAEGRIWSKNRLWDSPYPSHRAKVSGPFNRSDSSLPSEIPFDERFARLAGLYLAEGNLVSTHTHEVRWHFDYDGREDHLVNEVRSLLDAYGLRSWVEDKVHGTVVCCASIQLVTLFKALFGTGARSKRIHESVMQLPKNVLEDLLDAWIDGDGHRENMGVRDCIDTASQTLAMQIRYLLARTGRESVIRRKLDNSSEMVPGGKDIYKITWRTRGGEGKGGKHYFANDRVHQALCEPDRKHYSGPVYNLEVEDEHTYVMYPGIACHNCDWGQFQNLPRTRQWKRFQDRPCAHILAAYWQSKSTPLDEDRNPAGQMSMPGMGGPMSAPSSMPLMQAPQSPSPAPMAPGGPGPQGMPGPAQMSLGDPSGGMQAPSPEDVLPQFPMDPSLVPPHNPASIPGGNPGPTPTNPIQYPGGTFSKVAMPQHQNGDIVQLVNDDYGTLVGRSEAHGAGQPTPIAAGQMGEVLGTHPSTGMVNVLYMGKPFEGNGPMMPYGATAWHFPSDVVARPDVKKPGPAIRRSR